MTRLRQGVHLRQGYGGRDGGRVTFQGVATIHEFSDMDPSVIYDLHRGMKVDDEYMARACIIRVKPKGRFITYGVGVSLLTMRKPEEARGRVPV
jgi:hypothetical protein